MLRGLLVQKLRAAGIMLSLAVAIAPAVLAQPKVPPSQLIPTTKEAEKLAHALSSIIKPDLGRLSVSQLAQRAAESRSASQRDAIAQLKATLEQLSRQQRDIKNRLRTTSSSSDKKQTKRVKKELVQIEKQIKACDEQLADLLTKHELENKGHVHSQQGILSGGSFAFATPGEHGERMSGTYTTPNGTVFAATFLRDKDNIWVAVVRTKAPAAGNIIAKLDAEYLKALGFDTNGIGGTYQVLVWDKESDLKAAVARSPFYVSLKFSAGAVVKFLNLTKEINAVLGERTLPDAALVAIAMQEAPLASESERPVTTQPIPTHTPPSVSGGEKPVTTQPTSTPTRTPVGEGEKPVAAQPTSTPTRTPASAGEKPVAAQPTSTPTRTPVGEGEKPVAAQPTSTPTRTPVGEGEKPVAAQPTSTPTRTPASAEEKPVAAQPTSTPTRTPASAGEKPVAAQPISITSGPIRCYVTSALRQVGSIPNGGTYSGFSHCSGKVLASGRIDKDASASTANKRCHDAGVFGTCCTVNGDNWALTDGQPVEEEPRAYIYGTSLTDKKYHYAGACQSSSIIIPPAAYGRPKPYNFSSNPSYTPEPVRDGPIPCDFGFGYLTTEHIRALRKSRGATFNPIDILRGFSCTGNIVASGSMNGSTNPVDGAKYCSKTNLNGSCCEVNLDGDNDGNDDTDGYWVLTDGKRVASTDSFSSGNELSASCSQPPSLACYLSSSPVAGIYVGTETGHICSGKVLATGSMNDSDWGIIAAIYCSNAGIIGTCCSFDYGGKGVWKLTDGLPQLPKSGESGGHVSAGICQAASLPPPEGYQSVANPQPIVELEPLIGPCGIDRSELTLLSGYNDPLQCRIASSKSDYQIEGFGFIGRKPPTRGRQELTAEELVNLIPIYRMNDYGGTKYRTYYVTSHATADSDEKKSNKGGFPRILPISTTLIYKTQQPATVPIYAADSTTKGLYLSRIEADVTALINASKGLWKNKRILGYAYEKLPDDDANIDYGEFGSLYRMYNPIKKEYHYFFESSDGVNYWKEDPAPREITLGDEVGLKVITAGNPSCVEIGNTKLDPQNGTYKQKFSSENDDTTTYARIYKDNNYAECEISHTVNTELYRDFELNKVEYNLFTTFNTLPHCSGALDKVYNSYQMVMGDIDLPLTAKHDYETVGSFKLFISPPAECEKQLTLCRSIKTYKTSFCSVGLKTDMFNDYLADTNLVDLDKTCGANELRYDEAGYICPSQIVGTLPLSHLTNSKLGSHYYTTSDAEKADLIKNGWKFDKIIGYAPIGE